MRLNLPILDQLSGCRSLLIAGVGGGFDLFCGLPVYFELQSRGLQAHLASLSFTDLSRVRGGARITDTLVGVDGVPQGIDAYLPYFPELHLARWLRETRGDETPVWCFEKTGADPLASNYGRLADHLRLDGVLLIDGGVDSLVRGDEERIGTAAEDALSLFAVRQLPGLQFSAVACIGFGVE